MNYQRLLPAIIACTMLSACASKPPEPPVSDKVEKALLSSAESIEKSLKMLAQAEHFEKVEARSKVTRVYHLPGLRKEVSMQWDGELESAIAALAKMSDGYTYQAAIGKRPVVPVMISLPADKRSIQDLIESAALQAANKADVVIDQNTKIVQVRYVDDF